tara:strand:- start:374 stop:511 length:138 start_codon:yes stop_codon:yes gene_type:complete
MKSARLTAKVCCVMGAMFGGRVFLFFMLLGNFPQFIKQALPARYA